LLAASPTRASRDGGPLPSPRDAGASPAVVTAPNPPRATLYPSAASALRELLKSHPAVVAFGEFHQTKATARIPSALKRFTRLMLPVLVKAGATDLVVETWITTGSCGEQEKKAVAQVEKTTERPKHTENEVVTLLASAKRAGMQPRILQIGCKDYQAMMGGGEVDFDRLLRVTRDQLEAQIRAALARPGSRMVVSYGGALHNDLRPAAELAPYAFGPAVSKAVDGRYLEIDLYVPELIEKNATIRAQPWYAVYRHSRKPGRVTLVRRSDSSYALVFPRSR
jgi:hypothetical protein